MTASDLATKHCTACEGGAPKLDEAAIRNALRDLPGWELAGNEIARTFSFKNYYETMAFVNAIAWISHREDHHPDLEVGYNRCRVRYSTHSIGGVSQNDLICAARVDSVAKAE